MRYRISIAFILLAEQAVYGQAVQQPVVGSTSINTSVSVPDRGSMFLGGVSSAQSGRSQYGPLRSGTSTGLTRQGSSLSTHVYVIDLQAMDEALLNSRPPTSEIGREGNGIRSNRKVRETEPEVVRSPTEKMTQHEELARKAEKAGKTGLAKLHWQTALKYGSKIAEQRLADLNLPPSPSPTQASTTQSAAR